jgi:hypothetical protein
VQRDLFVAVNNLEERDVLLLLTQNPKSEPRIS